MAARHALIAAALLLACVVAAFLAIRSGTDQQMGDPTSPVTRPASPISPGTERIHDGYPAWSPDSAKIAFDSDRDGNSEIYIMDADGSAPQRITNHPADEGSPAWSPDGKKISFDSDRNGDFEIYVVNVDGSDPKRLTHHPARDVSASWSPDGSKIAFMSDRDGTFQIYVMNPDGSNPTKVSTAPNNWFPMWSPDGTLLTFHVDRDVHVMAADGSSIRRLTHDPDNGMYPSFSPDGSRIAFMSWREGRTEVFLMNADGTNQQRLTHTPRGDAIDPRWSPDGSRIAYIHVPNGMQASGPKLIFVVDVAGGEPRMLSRPPN